MFGSSQCKQPTVKLQFTCEPNIFIKFTNNTTSVEVCVYMDMKHCMNNADSSFVIVYTM